jgi:hypothetical protein
MAQPLTDDGVMGKLGHLSSPTLSVGFSSHNVGQQVDQQSKQHWHADDVHQRWEKRKGPKSGQQEKTSVSQQPSDNWNARKSDSFASSVRNANIVDRDENTAESQEHGRGHSRQAHSS